MIKQFYPYEYLPSVFCINYSKLWTKGIRGLIFDIDNTLVPHGSDATEQVEALLRHLQTMGFQVLLLTNNNEARTRRFCKNLDLLTVIDGKKPAPGGFLQALNVMNLPKDQVLVIGDSVFTDIRGANGVGLASILVKFIRLDPQEKIGKRRILEKHILWLYARSKKYVHRLGDIRKPEGGGAGGQETLL